MNRDEREMMLPESTPGHQIGRHRPFGAIHRPSIRWHGRTYNLDDTPKADLPAFPQIERRATERGPAETLLNAEYEQRRRAERDAELRARIDRLVSDDLEH